MKIESCSFYLSVMNQLECSEKMPNTGRLKLICMFNCNQNAILHIQLHNYMVCLLQIFKLFNTIYKELR